MFAHTTIEQAQIAASAAAGFPAAGPIAAPGGWAIGGIDQAGDKVT